MSEPESPSPPAALPVVEIPDMSGSSASLNLKYTVNLPPLIESVMPIEHWASQKGMLPRYIEQPLMRVRASDGRDYDVHPPAKHNDNFWKFAAAKALRAWVEGAEVTESVFDDAVHHACHDRIG